VLRDPQRNFLYGLSEQGEDPRVAAEPDCADLSFFLRAYFAWKLGLPVSWRACDRGSANRPPRCDTPEIDRSFTGATASADTFRRVSRRIIDRVTSGGGRTALNDDASDFYRCRWSVQAYGRARCTPTLRAHADDRQVGPPDRRPWRPAAGGGRPARQLGGRKRFWEGTFLFAQTQAPAPVSRPTAPLAAGAKGSPTRGQQRPPWSRRASPYSNEQERITPGDFYARMERLINPRGLDPEAAYEATLAALMEQLETRVQSVANGEEYMRAHPGTVVAMPKGPAIFETVGPWEDYATPSRDMRLLIALKVLEELPARIRNHPELYVLKQLLGLRLESATEAATRIEQLHARRIARSSSPTHAATALRSS